MAEPTQPGKAPIGIIKGQVPAPKPQAPAAPLSEYDRGFNKGHAVGKAEGEALGLHKGGHKNIWKGMGFAYASMLVAWLAMLGYDMSLSENKRAERFMAVREAEHTRDILNESAAMKAPVVEPDSK